MFIMSVRASTIRFFAAVLAGVTLLCGIMIFALSPSGDESAPVLNYSNIKTEEDRIAFLKNLGWEVKAAPIEVAEFTVPENFDQVLVGYNEIQKRQGLDLSRYARKTVTRYTYEITNYPNYSGTVYANIIVYRNKVIAGDVCSANGTDFVQGLGNT